MDWLAEYWPALVVALLVILLVLRLLTEFLPRRSARRHTGDQRIRVVGVGGAGGNAVNEMVETRRGGVGYLAINTDSQVLERSLADRRIHIGDQATRGLGAGGDPALGRKAAEEDEDALRTAVIEADLVFVAAGLGGGTGSGAAPLVAAYARDAGALTIAVVTMPFAFEGSTRRRVADAALAELRPNVDTLLVIENERVVDLIADDTPLSEAFGHVNDVLGQTIRAVVDIMATPGLVNLDFADVRTIMRDGGIGLTGIGRAGGQDRAADAARKAIASPLLSVDLHGARGVLLHVAGSRQLALREVVRAAEVVREAADPEANVIFGATFDNRLKDDVRVTVIATRFPEDGAFATAVSAAPAATLGAAAAPTSAAAEAWTPASSVESGALTDTAEATTSTARQSRSRRTGA
jgi:cell division protein FtsZ